MAYDPFAAGPFPVEARTIEAVDERRGRQFSCEIWNPAQPGVYPLIVFSHAAGNHRRGASFLCTHLCSHGYIVASMDHSEVTVPELRPRKNEPAEQKAARIDAVVASRVPDTQLLLRQLAGEPSIDWDRLGIAGHSFGGWTALAMPDVEPRIRAVVALAPGGASNPRPGVLPLNLAFDWSRDIPTLYLVAENDACLPLSGMYELFHRTPSTKQMFILRRADHLHFMDDAATLHEGFRTANLSPELAAIQRDMLPIAGLCSPEMAYQFARGLALSHFDAVLQGREDARRFLAGDIEAELAARGIEAIAHRP